MNYNKIRRKSRKIKVGSVEIGGESRLSIQSMTNTDTCDVSATIAQINALQNAGCDIVRIAVPTIEAAETVREIKATGIKVPVVADIHYDHKIALRCAELGVDKIRINPWDVLRRIPFFLQN